jgi:pimeloyl-ACP methyl ester carboxylesterase
MKVVFVAHTLVAGSLTRASQISTAELDGWRIAYESRGEGDEALVFVHGANSSRRIWHKQMDTLAIGRKLVAVDLIGHGDSDRPQTGYSMELFARSIAAVMDAEGIGCATLVGHSNGVPAVRQLYRLFPERVEAIVAVDGAFRNTISAEMAAWMRAAFARTDFEEFRAGMADMMPTFSLSDEDIALIRADMMATPKHVMEAGLESFVDPAIWRDDPIDTPLLILLAQQPTWTPEYIEYVRDIGPRVEYHMWENVSHFLMLERPDAFDELLTDFVGRLPGC